MSTSNIPQSSYSTIFHCDQGLFICFLRLFEGFISLGMFILFAKGYKIMSNQRYNRLRKEDKMVYLLAMGQTLMLTLYYLLFQQFFMLATIRNLMIWISINNLDIYCSLYWINQPSKLKIAKYCLSALSIYNISLWLFISLGDGSSLVNTEINLGYNCLLNDWMIMSGSLLVINTFSGMLAFFKWEELEFEEANMDIKKKHELESIKKLKMDILLMVGSGLTGAIIMFGWDYISYNFSQDTKSCQYLFSGDTFFRNVLAFLLKIICMQLNPCAIYYIVFYSQKEMFAVQSENVNDFDENYFNEGASYLNKTLSERSSSRKEQSWYEDKKSYYN